MRVFALLIVSLCFCHDVFSQTIIPNGVNTSTATSTPITVPSAYESPLLNYVRTWIAQKPITTPTQIDTFSEIDDVIQQTQYVDGLGRPLQMVNKGGSPLGKDVVSPIVYDAFGRESVKYLPYTATTSDGNFKNDPFNSQAAFMQGMFGAQGETFFYGKTVFEASPLNRPTKILAAGNSWSGSDRGIEINYELNESNEVRIWVVDTLVGSIPASSSYYDAGEIYRTITKDEDQKRVVEYKDKEGKVILKKIELSNNAAVTSHIGWLCTYYVYDDLNQLRFVLSPKATNLVFSSGTIATDIANDLCYRYEYDHRRRIIVKKVPGAREVHMVYDARDRLVFTQDGNMKARDWWHTTLYDTMNRAVMTGMMVYNGTREQLQNYENDSSSLSDSTIITIQGSHMVANLSINSRESGRILYQASSSIVFTNGFETETGANFLAEISTGTTSSTTRVVMGKPLPSGINFTALTQTFYDDYVNADQTYDNTDNSKLDSSSSLYPESLPAISSAQIKGAVTSSKVWTIEDANDLSKGKWLETVSFYDENGRVVQVRSVNVTGGNEIITSRYDFTGKVICTYHVHNNPESSAGTVRIKTNLDYDHVGRLLRIRKQINDQGEGKIIFQNEYDESGQLKTKKLGTDPNNTTSPLDTLDYDYNIRGWRTGINKDYVNNTNSTRYFGQSLSYDYGFNTQQYNGNISGVKWKSKGDGEQRAYGFEYDNVNRIRKADFTQNNGAWNVSAGLDFSVSGDSTGKIEYDFNGNILQMKQMGWKVTGSSPIDNMRYSYNPNSNKLLAVSEISLGSTDNKLGDFTDKNINWDDYTYDENGNLSIDKNKNISSITYNHLNLPYIITVTGKGTITYTYDASGNKLMKKVIEGNTTKSTIYIGGFIYEKINNGSDELLFFAHEEGRSRKTSDTSFVFDYFIKDHSGNVRTVLTEEQKSDTYPPATMESSLSITEEAFYSNITNTRNDLPDGYPVDTSYSNPNIKVAKTSGSGNKIGPAIMLKVMAGDKFNVMVSSWYKKNGITPTTPSSPVTDLVNAINNSIAPFITSHTTISQLSGSGALNMGILSFNSSHTGDSTTKPKAYVNWVLFDEQFKYVGNSSGFEQVGNDNTLKIHQFSNLPINKNGYLYVYVSNETPNIDVFFDNLQVTHNRGPLLEETHYYPFGLSMAGISTRAVEFGKPSNKFKYNGIEQNTDFDLNMYDAHYRNLDPQIGRFWQIDPRPNETLSSYAAMANNPILYSDPLGDTTWLYGNDGKYLGMTADLLENQIHFLNGTIGEGVPPMDFSSLSVEDQTTYAKSFREQSIAFMGKNTLVDMQTIKDAAVKANKEVIFTGKVGKDKEIRLTALKTDKGEYGTMEDVDKILDAKYSNQEQAGMFLFGHVHQQKLSTSGTIQVGSAKDPLYHFGRPSSPGYSDSGDYGPYLHRSATATQKGQSPALILSRYGFTVYGTATAKPTYMPEVKSYLVPGRVVPSTESYFLYQKLKK